MLPLPPGPFAGEQLLRDPYVLVVPADSPLARRERPPTLREIVELPLIGNRHCRSLDAGLAALRSTGKEPRIVFRSDDNGTVQGITATGMGAALVPRLTVDETDERVAEEAADVLYHLAVLLRSRGLSLADAGEVLDGRRR